MQIPICLSLPLVVLALAGCASNPTSRAGAASVAANTDANAAPRPLDEARLREAQMFKQERRYAEVEAIYAEQTQLQPENAWLVAEHANAVADQARAETDPAKARALFKRARELALRAEQLGTTNPLTPMIIAGTRPDGSRESESGGAFSQHEQADKLIRDGEAAFTAHDFEKAWTLYQQAAELEPTNYMAALWTGDAYFSARKYGQACDWFRKTITIAPTTETAHRYLGDALAKLGRKEEAMNEWITAVICEPYQRVTRQHFTEELRAVAEAKEHRIPRFGVGGYSVDSAKHEIGISKEADNLQALYALACANWRIENFASQFPQEREPRRSLREELAGLELLIATHEATAQNAEAQGDATLKAERESWQPILNGLVALKREGLLEAYALLERVDLELAKDYTAYREAHWAELERYIRVYWCGF